jgi:hypothetical protein
MVLECYRAGDNPVQKELDANQASKGLRLETPKIPGASESKVCNAECEARKAKRLAGKL